MNQALPHEHADLPRGAVQQRPAEAVVFLDSVHVLNDPLDLITQPVIDLARTSLMTDEGSVSFVMYGGRSGTLLVTITRPQCSPHVREVKAHDAKPRSGLTIRQLEVLTLIAFGCTNHEVSERLGIRPKTVGAHVEDVFNRLGVGTRALAAAVALEQNLLFWGAVPTGTAFSSFRLSRLKGAWEHSSNSTARRPPTPPSSTTPSTRGASRISTASLRIASIVPAQFPGESSDMIQAATMAIERRNERNGIHGTPIEHCVIECDVFDTSSMSEALRRATNSGADAVLLGYNLDYPNTESFLRAAGDAEVPVIHASTSQLAIATVADNQDRLGNIFHICGGDELYGHGVDDFLRHLVSAQGSRLRGRRLAFIEAPTGMNVIHPYSQERIEDLGIQLSTIPRSDPLCNAEDRARIVESMKSCDPDIIVCASFLDHLLLVDVMRSLVDRPVKPLVFSFFTPSLAGFLEENADLAEGIVWSTQTGIYGDAFGKRFRQEFLRSNGRSPGYSQAGVQYDAVNMLIRSWLEAAHPRNYADVIAQMRDTPYRGVNGSYWLARAGQAPLSYPHESLDGSLAQAQLIYQVRNGANVVIQPDAYAQAQVDLTGTVLGLD
ncbi:MULTISPECIES: ABC transporter substrate-binding protein [unclassified Actinomyces]|uniref:ABC transporter substrate-binding protein n=1 Tax=unclassified Actinomyces TaxID=2609248 RepID=UPI0020182BD5|nr:MULTISPECIES: ABC transporter substrate-binding protein [unclassified Actinomyces]MCL3778059.1 ABC transporter substrate-binding protein [Actinomyces sp. AC-20-1]MCL3789855.1 ABC transporter substrate-binding protein [Actinomyces sp. 187325]MCL3792010.1 ABC transporter substrate-binding protein [Actinomyces sp. 186855]MCL3794712.1 ABC transporter substrate-binding protein [Actinomyces sp. 217892]